MLILFVLISLGGSIRQPYGWRWRVLTFRLSLSHLEIFISQSWMINIGIVMDSEVSQYQAIKQ